MKINRLILKNYRTYSNACFTFSDSLNIIVGKNAQGKTNLIEAIYLLSHSKSFRTKNYRDLISLGADVSYIQGDVIVHKHPKVLEMALFNKGKKAKINGLVCKKSSDFVGVFNVVVFSPDDLLIVKGEPRLRRNFIDIELSKLSHIYLTYWNQYMHFLKERNIYLKKGVDDKVYLDVITDQLVQCEIEVAKRRFTFVRKLNVYCAKIYEKLSNGCETLDISYDSFISFDVDELKQMYKEQLAKDLKYRTTTLGIHKDDLKITINGLDAKQFASQGQQRSIVLALKIGLVKLILQEIGEYPVLLLDDVMSELDETRQCLLLELISDDIQTFITTTSLDSLGHEVLASANKIHIMKERKSSV